MKEHWADEAHCIPLGPGMIYWDPITNKSKNWEVGDPEYLVIWTLGQTLTEGMRLIFNS